MTLEPLNINESLITEEKATNYFEDFLFQIIDAINMADVLKDFILEQVPVTDTKVYTCPAATTAEIKGASCFNDDAGAVVLNVNIVQSGGSVATTNQYVQESIATVDSSDKIQGVVGVVLEAGDFISAKSDNAASLNLKVGIAERMA